MEIITREMINKLSQSKGSDLISIYLPTHRMGRAIQQDPIRLKNLLSSAARGLEERGLRKPEIDDLLQPVENLLVEGRFWQKQGDGLALFISPDFFRFFRLPVTFNELLVIGERFHLKPLMPLISGDGQFYVLALSQNMVRLLHGSRFSIVEVDLENVPTSLRQALRFDDPERQLQYHTGTGAPGGDRRRDSMFHGHGSSEDESKEKLLRYFRLVDKGLMEFIGEERYPLVLAGVDYLLPIYQQASSYPNLVGAYIEGSPDDLTAEALHQKAWETMAPIFQQQQSKALEKFKELYVSGNEQAVIELDNILPAAHSGQVETLFVALGEQVWGKWTPHENKVELHTQSAPQDQDLLDLAAVQTLMNGGVVYALDQAHIPEKALAAAVYRYSYQE